MGCGASTHAQGTAPPVAQKARGSQQEAGGAPVPVAEDARAPEQTNGQTATGPGVGSNGVTPKSPQGRVSGGEAAAAGQQQDGEAHANGNGNGNGGLALALRGSDGPPGSGHDSAVDANGNGGGSLLDPAVTPHGGTATVTLGLGSGGTGGGGGGGESAAHGFNARSRYTNQSELSMASTSYDLSGRGDSDSEDELEALFTMASWKRFYAYNKKKHHDLLTYFWRKFPPSGYSLWCVSYRYGDLLLAPFMADNVAAGYMARLEELPALAGGVGGGDGGGGHLADEVFCQMYSLHDYEADEYRVVGLLLAPGGALPPALAALANFDGFAYLKADSSSTHVKQFVSALLVGKSPLTSLSLLSGREVA